MTPHRQVFFLSGFDPKSSPQYHRMYRDAAAHRPAQPAGDTATVSKRRDREGLNTHWEVHWHRPGQPDLLTRYTVLGWHDIVHAHWPRTLWRVLRDYAIVYLTAWPDGTFARLWRTSRATFWLTQFPLLLALACLGLSAGAGAGVAGLAGEDALAGALIGLAGGAVLWRELAKALDAEWILRLLGFTYDQTHDHLPELEARTDDMARQLVAAAEAMAQDGGHELLVVGHSTGTMLAMSVVARALALAPWLGTRGPALGLLTLGHSVPLLAFQPRAQRFRAEIERLAAHAPLCWVDYSAPTDWAAFHPPAPWLDRPTQGLKRALSPRFHQILRPERYQAMRPWHKRHALHLQYLRAPDVAGGYDLLTLTAGPWSLAQQHTSTTS